MGKNLRAGKALPNDGGYASEAWYMQRRLERVNDIRRNAKRLYGKSVLLKQIGDKEAELAARKLLGVAASAFWNAEDTDLEVLAHEELDQYGKWVRSNFVCHLSFEGGTYYQTCPVAIAHKRMGLSIGFTARVAICSICGEDMSECIHRADRLYEVPGGAGPSGYCSVCGGSECQEHSPDEMFLVAPIRIVTEADLHEVSVVRKPAQPDARITKVPVDGNNLRSVLSPSFEVGDPVTCDRCLNACRGIEEISSLM